MSSENDAIDTGNVFEVAIGRGNGAGRFRVEVIRSPAGEAIAETSLDVSHLLARRPEFQQAVLDSAVRTRQILTRQEQSIQDAGRVLFAALLGAPPIAALYAASVVAAGKLRIILRITSPELAPLPWEAMYDPEAGAYLGLRHHLVRHVAVTAAPPPLTVSLPLRVLGVISAPHDLASLEAQHERKNLERALAGLVRQGSAEVTWAPSATWDGLHQMLKNGPWHVIHFIGHGTFDPVHGEGILVLENEEGNSHEVSARRFADLLQLAQPMPRLVVLNACSSGTASVDDLFAGTASALARSGVPAVAAMQYAVYDDAAVAFARGFYNALALGDGVDEAAFAGRFAILGTGAHTLEWLTPVLYLRGNNAQLFDLKQQTRGKRRLLPWGIAVAGVAIAIAALAVAPNLRKSPITHPGSTTSATLVVTIPEPGSGGISSVAFSPNNEVLAASDATSGSVHEWTPGASNPACTEPDPDRAAVSAVAFNGTSNVLAVAGSAGHVYLWACDELVDTLTDPFPSRATSVPARVTSVTFSSDGAFLTAGDSAGHVYTWVLDDYPMKQNVKYTVKPATVAVGGGPVSSVTFNDTTINDPQNTVLAAGTANGDVEVLNPKPQAPQVVYAPSHASIQAMTFASDDQYLVAADNRGDVYEWQCLSAAGDTVLVRTRTLWLTDQHGTDIDAIAAYPQGDLIAAADANGYIVVGANDKVTLTVKDPADSPVRSVAFSANGEYLAAGAANGDVYLWKVSL